MVRRAANTARRRAKGIPERSAAPITSCGTANGYRRHRRAGEDACEPCKAAERERARQQYHDGPAREAHRRRYWEGGVREQRMGEYRERKPNALRQHEIRRCPVCWEDFVPNHGRRKYCGDFCASLAVEMSKGRGKRLLALRHAAPADRAAMVAKIAARRQTTKAALRATRYGRSHQLERERQLAEYNPVSACPRCMRPLGDDPAQLDLDHDDDDPSRYLGLSHSTCNRRRLPIIYRPSPIRHLGQTMSAGAMWLADLPQH